MEEADTTKPATIVVGLAPTSRALCVAPHCRTNILKGELRVGDLTDFRGKSEGSVHYGYRWYHLTRECSDWLAVSLAGINVKDIPGIECVLHNKERLRQVEEWLQGEKKEEDTTPKRKREAEFCQAKVDCAEDGEYFVLCAQITYRCRNNECRRVDYVRPTEGQFGTHTGIACSSVRCRREVSDSIRTMVYQSLSDEDLLRECQHCHQEGHRIKPNISVQAVTDPKRANEIAQAHGYELPPPPKKKKK